MGERPKPLVRLEVPAGVRAPRAAPSGSDRPSPFPAQPAGSAAPVARPPGVDTVPGAVRLSVEGATNYIADARQLQAMQDLLRKSMVGTAAVNFIEERKIAVVFVSGAGTFWDKTHNRIVIDRNTSMEESALALVHEGWHAKVTASGGDPDIRGETRSDYLRNRLKAEVAATSAEITVRNELRAVDASFTNGGFGYNPEWDAAARQGAADYLRAHPTAGPFELSSAGHKAAKEDMMKRFMDGEIVTSTTLTPYRDYYGEAWDKAQLNPVLRAVTLPKLGGD